MALVLITPFITFLIVTLAPRFWKSLAILGAFFELILTVQLALAVKAQGKIEKTIFWFPEYGLSLKLFADGLSVLLIALTALLTLLVLIHAYFEKRERGYDKEYFLCYLALEGVLQGAFLTTNLLGFYIFFDAMLIPMFLIIGVWGSGRRVYSAFKFSLFTFFGSVFFLLAVIVLGFLHKAQFGFVSFNLTDILKVEIPPNFVPWLFAAFIISFAIKIPLIPVHVWLPDAHTEAPTGGSVILAGILLKVGSYAFLRFAIPIFWDVINKLWYFLGWIAVVSVIAGALLALVQPDLKRLVAYSSISHMGYVMLGAFAASEGSLTTYGLSGSILHMVNHGVATGALFFLVGMLYERKHTRMIDDYGGVAKVAPIYTALFFTAALSSIGLPSTGGFIGEILVVLGAFKASKLLAALCASGMILSAGYMLWAMMRVFFGTLSSKNADIEDAKPYELLVMLPLVALIFSIGIYPKPFLEIIDGGVRFILDAI